MLSLLCAFSCLCFLLSMLSLVYAFSCLCFLLSMLSLVYARPCDCPQREGMGLLENQAMPFLRDVAHYGVLCTLGNRSAPDRGKWCSPSGQAAWTVHHVQDDTLLGPSPPASHVGRRAGPGLYSIRPKKFPLKQFPFPQLRRSRLRRAREIQKSAPKS